jgi:hypothetical protein
MLREPVRRGDESPGEELDVEDVPTIQLLRGCEEVEEQRRDSRGVERTRDLEVPG